LLTRASQESPSRVAPPGARRGHPRYARVHAFARPRTPETMSADETADLDALQLVCPITAELFEDPVLLVEDGHTYERSAVTAWLEKHDTSPMSGAALATKTLAPNIRARQQADTARGSKPPLDGKRHNEVTNLGPARAAANAAATGASERNARFVRRPLEIEPAPPPSAPPPPPPAPGKFPLTPPHAEKMSREAAKKARADAEMAEALMDEERKAAEADAMDPGEAASSKERRLPSKEEHAAKGETKQWQKEAAAKEEHAAKEAAANAAELTRWVRSYDEPNGGPRGMQRPAYDWFDSHDPWEHRWPVHRAAMRGECDRIRELTVSTNRFDANAKMTDWYDSEPLGWAASFGQLDAVRALIECGADPLRPPNAAGNTPLRDAEREGHAHVVRFLKEYAYRKAHGVTSESVINPGVVFRGAPDALGDPMESNFGFVMCPVFGHPEFDKGAYHAPLGCCCAVQNRAKVNFQNQPGFYCEPFVEGFKNLLCLPLIVPCYVVTCFYKPCGGLCWWGDAPCTEQRVTPQYARVFPCCLTRGAAVDRRRDARRETQEMIGHGFSVKNAPSRKFP